MYGLMSLCAAMTDGLLRGRQLWGSAMVNFNGQGTNMEALPEDKRIDSQCRTIVYVKRRELRRMGARKSKW